MPARQFAESALPLDRVYVLASGDQFAVEPLAKAEAMMELMRHTYQAEQYTGLFGLKEHMRLSGALANVLPAQRLVRPRDWSRLAELVRFIEQQVASEP